MPSPFLRNQQKILARSVASSAPRAAGAPPPAPDAASEAGREYHTLLAVLHNDLRSLQDIHSIKDRDPKKAEMAQKYRDWIDGVIEADKPVQDDILVTNMIWALDYRDFAYFLALADFAMGHDLAMPSRYERTLACFLLEEPAEVALKDPDAVPHHVLEHLATLAGDADMPDQAKAKFHKALGRSWRAKAEAFDAADDNAVAGSRAAAFASALWHLKQALKLDEKSGVKTDIRVVSKALAALSPEDDEKE